MTAICIDSIQISHLGEYLRTHHEMDNLSVMHINEIERAASLHKAASVVHVKVEVSENNVVTVTPLTVSND